MENYHVQWVNELKMMSFSSYVSLPEGRDWFEGTNDEETGRFHGKIMKHFMVSCRILQVLPENQTIER